MGKVSKFPEVTDLLKYELTESQRDLENAKIQMANAKKNFEQASIKCKELQEAIDKLDS